MFIRAVDLPKSTDRVGVWVCVWGGGGQTAKPGIFCLA